VFSIASLQADFCLYSSSTLGCPQGWAYQEGIGSALLSKPQLVRDLVRSVKGIKADKELPVSVKIRIDNDLKSVFFLIHFSPSRL
jgi:tRNA-dihydrouridine synthase 4